MGRLPGELSDGEGGQVQGALPRPGIPRQGGGGIRLRNLEVRNYRKFRQASLEFPDGVVGILGSNGSGKSTLMEAVAWALYGNEKSITRDGKKEGVRSSFANMNDDCSVLLDFEIAGDHYRLYRAMKGRSQTMEAQLSVNGKQLAKTDKGVTDEIRRILGMDYKSFFISVFARQKELNALSSLSAAERGKVVRRMLGIESLTKTVEEIDRERKSIQDRLFGMQQDQLAPDGSRRSDLLRNDLDQLSRTKSEAERELDSVEKALAAVQRDVASAMERRDALNSLEEAHSKLQAERLANRKDTEAARSNADKARQRIKELEGKREEIAALDRDHAAYEEASRKKELLDSRAQAFERRKALAQQRADAETKSSKAKAALADRERMFSACADSRKRLQTVEESISTATGERDTLRERSRLLEADDRRLTKEAGEKGKKLEEIRRLGPESECPTCERKLCDQHSFLVDKLEKELTELQGQAQEARAELTAVKQELEQRRQKLDALDKRRKELLAKCDEEVRAQEALRAAREKLDSTEEELSAVQRAMDAIQIEDYSEEEHASLRRGLQELRPRWERHRALTVELEALPRWQGELHESEADLRTLGDQAKGIEARISSLGYEEGERKRAQDALDSLLSVRERTSAQVAQADKRLERNKAEEAAKRSALEELEQREKAAEEISRQLEEQSALSKAMRDFRESMMARVVPTLSELSSRLFEELTDGKYPGMELDADYEISVFDRGEKYALSRFSGGEADLANLCLRLAISKVISERAGSALNFLILDEIFGSQDQGRKRNIMEAFGQLSKQFSQILLITHIEDVKDLVGGAIVVQENEDGSSSVSVVG
ncbi:MAG: SMC family ATPase [Methanomassiliicoccales archaeon]|nr:SMC family ATPase [Methanomassiliicoccales archaeon]